MINSRYNVTQAILFCAVTFQTPNFSVYTDAWVEHFGSSPILVECFSFLK